MGDKMWSSVAVIVLLFAAGALSDVAQPYKIPGINSIFLGAVEGKSYVADDSIPLNWNAAKAHCASLGMRLASVETPAEKDFLAAIDHPQFQSYYWTAGRDAQSAHQFAWDHNSKSVSENLVFFSYIHPERTCMLYNSRTSSKSYQSGPCEASASGNGHGPFGALCESTDCFEICSKFGKYRK